MRVNLTNLVALLVVLGPIIFVHEFGHLLAAKAFGMRVLVFSFGFGKRLLGFKWGETDCRISLLPLGGYVKIAGEGDDHLSESTVDAVTDDGHDFASHPRWQRFLMYLAGPTMNLVFTYVVYSILFTWTGGQVEGVRFDRPILGVIEAASPASSAGLLPGDLVLSINGEATTTWEDVMMPVLHSAGRTLEIKLRRGAEELSVTLKAGTEQPSGAGTIGASALVRVGKAMEGKPAKKAGILAEDGVLAVDGTPIREFTDIPNALRGKVGVAVPFRILRGSETIEIPITPEILDGAPKVGIEPKLTIRKFGPLGAMVEGGRQAWHDVERTVWTVKQLVTARISPGNLRGPVGIAETAGNVARDQGWLAVLLLLAPFLSVSVGILNLLPVPPLDGGHMLFLTIEGILRRDLSLKVKEGILMVGLGLLVALIVFVFYSDLVRNKLFGLLGH